MRTTVTVTSKGDFWAVAFSERDDTLLGALKSAVPPASRRYEPHSREWHIREDVTELLVTLEQLGARVSRPDEQADGRETESAAHWKRRYDAMDATARQQLGYIQQLEHDIAQLQDRVRQLREQAPHHAGSSGTWAEQLFLAVGGARADAVFKALAKILHPDVGKAGDTVLMQQLNDAR
ncbi:hypothetical protein [Nocardia neocaledoniensis]|uniref:hypothetical protein n=1 Tax=Nocardia neocaledoniensis TaxID=236511 RepID=UPI0024570007|nr:hypothetical protein [Nocardia neocaledoniensis]